MISNGTKTGGNSSRPSLLATKRLLPLARAAVVFLCVFLSAAPVYAGLVGSAAPAFRLSDADGNVVTLGQFRGKVVFLDFWAPWCTPCRHEMPALDGLVRKFGKEGFQVIGISVDRSRTDVKAFLQNVPVGFPVLLDNGDVSAAYLVTGLPTGFIVDRDGIIRHIHRGYGKEFLSMYEKEIEELLKKH